MLATIAGFLTALGFGSWIAGIMFRYRGLAVIGGVLVVGVGAMVTTGGLQYETGTAQTAAYESQAVNASVTNETVAADHGTWVPLHHDDQYNQSETVWYFDESLMMNGAWTTAERGEDYEYNHTGGAIQTQSLGGIDDDETIKVSYTYAERSELVATNESTSREYRETDTPTHLPLGVLWMLLGSVFVFRGLNTNG